jgi:hypothetical protein
MDTVEMGRMEGSVETRRIPTPTNKVSILIGGRGRREGKVGILATTHTTNHSLSRHVQRCD